MSERPLSTVNSTGGESTAAGRVMNARGCAAALQGCVSALPTSRMSGHDVDTSSEAMVHVVGAFDGNAKNNHLSTGERRRRGAPAAGGSVLRVEGTTIRDFAFAGQASTNNKAEYVGLVRLLCRLRSWYLEAKPDLPVRVEIYGDSQDVIGQMRGEMQVGSVLSPQCSTAMRMVRDLRDLEMDITFHHVPRAENTIADEYANFGIASYMDKQRGKPTRVTHIHRGHAVLPGYWQGGINVCGPAALACSAGIPGPEGVATVRRTVAKFLSTLWEDSGNRVWVWRIYCALREGNDCGTDSDPSGEWAAHHVTYVILAEGQLWSVADMLFGAIALGMDLILHAREGDSVDETDVLGVRLRSKLPFLLPNLASECQAWLDELSRSCTRKARIAMTPVVRSVGSIPDHYLPLSVGQDRAIPPSVCPTLFRVWDPQQWGLAGDHVRKLLTPSEEVGRHNDTRKWLLMGKAVTVGGSILGCVVMVQQSANCSHWGMVACTLGAWSLETSANSVVGAALVSLLHIMTSSPHCKDVEATVVVPQGLTIECTGNVDAEATKASCLLLAQVGRSRERGMVVDLLEFTPDHAANEMVLVEKAVMGMGFSTSMFLRRGDKGDEGKRWTRQEGPPWRPHSFPRVTSPPPPLMDDGSLPFGCAVTACPCRSASACDGHGSSELYYCPYARCSTHREPHSSLRDLGAHLREKHGRSPALTVVAARMNLSMCDGCHLPYLQLGRHIARPGACAGRPTPRPGGLVTAQGGEIRSDLPQQRGFPLHLLDKYSFPTCHAIGGGLMGRVGKSDRHPLRVSVMCILIEVMERVVRCDPSTLHGVRCWKLLAVVGRMLVGTRRFPGEEGMSFSRRVSKRVSMFREGMWEPLLQGVLGSVGGVQEAFSEEAVRAHRFARATQLTRAGRLGQAARILRSSAPVASITPETIAELQALHPCGGRNNVPVGGDVVQMSEQSFPEFTERSEERLDMRDGLSSEEPTLEVDELERHLCSYLRRAPRASGVGATSWTFEWIKSVMRCGVRGSALVTKLISLFLTGRLPVGAKPFWFGGRLVPLRKPNGKLRPIAVGEAFVRAGAGALVGKFRARFAEIFAGLQFGAGTPGGAELVAHAVREAGEAHPDWICVSVDLVNGFNSVARSAVRDAVVTHKLHELATFVDSVYGGSASLAVRAPDGSTQWVSRREGLAQGCPLSPSLFALATLSALKRAATAMQGSEREGPDFAPLAYLDDVTFIGPQDRVMRAIPEYVKAVEEVGLRVNNSKTVIWTRQVEVGWDVVARLRDVLDDERSALVEAHNHSGDTMDGIPSNLPFATEGIVCVGIPVGTPEWEREQAVGIVQSHKNLLDALVEMPHKQCALLLLRYCAQPRVSFLARGLPLDNSSECMREHDLAVQSCLQRMFGLSDMANARWRQQAALPVRCAGLGVGGAFAARHAAVLGVGVDVLNGLNSLPGVFGEIVRSSWLENKSPTSRGLRDALEWAEELAAHLRAKGDTDWSPPMGVQALAKEERRYQNKVFHLHGRRAYDVFFRSAPSERDQARLRALVGAGATAWLAAIPVVRELEFSAATMGHAVRLFLGEPVRGLVLGPCGCGRIGDADDDHLMLCNWRGALTRRHNVLRDTLMSMLVCAGIQVVREPQGIDPLFRSREGGDLLIWRNGKYLLVDVTVVHPRGRRGALQQGAHERDAVRRKEQQYKERAARAGWDFEVAAFETYGALPSSVVDLVKLASDQLGRWEQLHDTTWVTRNANEYFTQVLSCAVWRESVRVMVDNHRAGLCAVGRSLEFDPHVGEVLRSAGSAHHVHLDDSSRTGTVSSWRSNADSLS